MSPRTFLYLTAFSTGAAVMAAELGASRLVAPFYGTSTPVWALLIGTVLSSMAVGQLLGGWLAARTRSIRPLGLLLLASAALLALLPVVARPIMGGSLEIMRHGAVGALAASAVGVTAVLALPMLVLGAAGPMLIHQAVETREATGQVAGRLYALGTAGSLVGTWLSGLFLVPLLGSTSTLWLCAAGLAGIGVVGLERGAPRRLALAAVLATATGLALTPRGPVKDRPGAIHEQETRYNYVQVTENGNVRSLYLNEGYATQSVYLLDGSLPLHGVWGYYGLAPSWTTTGAPERVLLVGLGGGTSARILRSLYPGAEIVGVELDPGVVEAGRRYMGLPDDIEVVVQDARTWLHVDDSHYDLVLVDAFQFPYVPFQLTTREFFATLGDHLAPGGAVVLNIGRDRESREVVDAVAATLATELPVVRGVDLPNGGNTILVGTHHHADQDAGLRALGISGSAHSRLARLAPVEPWQPDPASVVLTDERAPVELLTDHIVLRRLVHGLVGRAS